MGFYRSPLQNAYVIYASIICMCISLCLLGISIPQITKSRSMKLIGDYKHHRFIFFL